VVPRYIRPLYAIKRVGGFFAWKILNLERRDFMNIEFTWSYLYRYDFYSFRNSKKLKKI